MTTGQSPNEDREPAVDTIYCMHCGTATKVGEYACARCGERVYLPDPSRVPPLGFTSCQDCAAVNEAHASFCASCSVEIDQRSRISPDGADHQQGEKGDDSFRRRRQGEETSSSEREERSAGYRIGAGTFRPDQWGFSRRSRSNRSEDKGIPQEIRRWNWAAFILGPIWGMVHGIWWSLLGFLPFLPLPPVLRVIGLVVLVGVMFVLGRRGNEIAWRTRQWKSPESFLAVQQRFSIWSIVFAIGALVAIFIFFLGQG